METIKMEATEDLVVTIIAGKDLKAMDNTVRLVIRTSSFVALPAVLCAVIGVPEATIVNEKNSFHKYVLNM
tara:strand:+ start:2323 stop:2535 length:213 start_codon:yes stop_codon:yes gene_type:complete